MGETELQRCLVQDTKTTKKGERIGEEGRDGGGWREGSAVDGHCFGLLPVEDTPTHTDMFWVLTVDSMGSTPVQLLFLS